MPTWFLPGNFPAAKELPVSDGHLESLACKFVHEFYANTGLS